MRVSRIIEKTYAEGPGCRFCIWVQGCNHRCKGCFAKELWDYNKGYEIDVKDIIDMIDSVKDKVEGITLLGGEPFDKASDLAEIAKYMHSIDKNVITFTGYTYEQIINSNNARWNELINHTDLLIDGKFEERLIDYSRPMVGSSNQRFFYFSDRISEELIKNYKNRFEIRYENRSDLF